MFSNEDKIYRILRTPKPEIKQKKIQTSAFLFDVTNNDIDNISEQNPGKIIVEKKALCELDNTITLRTWYSSHKQGAEYSYNCSNSFENLAANVGIHMTNYLKNPYSPNDHWGYSWMGNSGTPTQDGRTYYYTNNNTIRLRTLCNGKLNEDTISGN